MSHATNISQSSTHEYPVVVTSDVISSRSYIECSMPNVIQYSRLQTNNSSTLLRTMSGKRTRSPSPDPPKVTRVSRRKHGYKFTKPLATQEECDRVLHSIQAKKPSKVIVTVESAFAEFPDRVNYRNGLESASKHLDMAVESLEKGWVDVLNDYNRQPTIRCNMGYTESELMLTIDPKRCALNQAQLQIMKTTSAEKMVETRHHRPVQVHFSQENTTRFRHSPRRRRFAHTQRRGIHTALMFHRGCEKHIRRHQSTEKAAYGHRDNGCRRYRVRDVRRMRCPGVGNRESTNLSVSAKI